MYTNIQREKKKLLGRERGFTLIEILVVIGIIAILASVVLVAVNPIRQFKLARDSQRISNVNAILNAIGEDISEHGGLFNCVNGTTNLPDKPTIIKNDDSGDGFDLAACVVTAYISSLPFDPSATNAHYTSPNDYDTEYSVYQNSNGGVTVSANGELTQISVTR